MVPQGGEKRGKDLVTNLKLTERNKLQKNLSAWRSKFIHVRSSMITIHMIQTIDVRVLTEAHYVHLHFLVLGQIRSCPQKKLCLSLNVNCCFKTKLHGTEWTRYGVNWVRRNDEPFQHEHAIDKHGHAF